MKRMAERLIWIRFLWKMAKKTKRLNIQARNAVYRTFWSLTWLARIS
jgi:hypothetical protein